MAGTAASGITLGPWGHGVVLPLQTSRARGWCERAWCAPVAARDCPAASVGSPVIASAEAAMNSHDRLLRGSPLHGPACRAVWHSGGNAPGEVVGRQRRGIVAAGRPRACGRPHDGHGCAAGELGTGAPCPAGRETADAAGVVHDDLLVSWAGQAAASVMGPLIGCAAIGRVPAAAGLPGRLGEGCEGRAADGLGRAAVWAHVARETCGSMLGPGRLRRRCRPPPRCRPGDQRAGQGPPECPVTIAICG